MRREICGECGAPINDDGTCDCTELLKRGWRKCAVGQKTTQWCAMAETLLREQRQRDEDLLRQALDALAYWLEHGETPGSHDIIQRTHDVLRKRLKLVAQGE